jgi:hypothetical protein
MAEKGFKRKLTAILSADAVQYSRLMGEDEEATVRTLTAYREVLTTLIQQHNGKVLDSPGDNLLADFASLVDAVKCAVAVQKEIKARNDELPQRRRMHYRIGINLGDVILEEERIYGDGVNIAARLEGLADPGGICISRTAYDHVKSLPTNGEMLRGILKVPRTGIYLQRIRSSMPPSSVVTDRLPWPTVRLPAEIRITIKLLGANSTSPQVEDVPLLHQRSRWQKGNGQRLTTIIET